MLPAAQEFWSHPFSFITTYGHVYKLHTDHISAETAERRKNKVDDVQKRSRYRKAHGLEKEQGFGGWTAKTDAELLGPAIPTGDVSPGQQNTQAIREASPINPEQVETPALTQTERDPSHLINVPEKKPPVKRWFGIWS
ncbi:MAG: hypothetical protein Q9218_000955 [Villophora microphyllina]